MPGASRPPARLVVLSLLISLAAAQRGSAFRCRDRDPQCKSWSGRGECSSNHAFMAETCPQACDYCENAGLMPTPSPFQLDLVCKGDQLAINPGTYKGGAADDLPGDCEFRCRDNLTASICFKAAAEGKCEDVKFAQTVRFQCPESCGVCKALEMPPATYPKPACREAETGNAAEHQDSCDNWAADGECIANFGFMSVSCEAACGLCEVGAAAARTPAQINAPPPPPRRPKAAKKKKRKKSAAAAAGDGGEVASGGDAASEAASSDEAAPEAAGSAAPEAGTAEGEGGKKKKGWMGKAKEAVGNVLSKGKNKAAPLKDET